MTELLHRNTILDILPYDIVNAIFSLLDQPTCLECMTVCRAWYKSIPYYAIDLWKTVEFKRYKFNLNDRRLARCLGSHVKKCMIAFYEDKEVWATLDLLTRTKCDQLHSIGNRYSAPVQSPGMFLRSKDVHVYRRH
ncbi:hypothetical protein BX666DRAFT_1373140 [Dichotomocladium elegans]|nr:hypothetical protein BX666DRAFT_1373140 [Dichotomocladium elegans]